MRKFLKKRWHNIPLGIVVAICLLTAGAAYAAVSVLKEIPAELEVVPRTERSSEPVDIYRNPECTDLLTQVRWTGIQRGNKGVAGFFIKNTSSQALTVKMKVSPDISSWATLRLAPAENPPANHPEIKTSSENFLALNPRDVGWFWSEITILLNAPLGTKTFRFQVYVE